MKKIFLPLFLGIFFVACSTQGNQIIKGDGYQLFIPSKALYKIQRPDKSIAYSTNEKPFNKNPEDYLVEIYQTEPSPHCKEIGVSDPETKKHAGTQIVRGKVDFPPDYELTKLQPDCRIYKPYTASYILCSEKDDTQVAICISQVTDDPSLANSIFDTFRWTGEEIEGS